MGMAIFGGILIVLGIILGFVWRHYQNKLRGMRLARGTTVAELADLVKQVSEEMGGGSLRQYVKLRGQIRCDQPLMSELKQLPCVHYSMRVVREYEEQVTERDSEGKTRRETRRGSETITSNSQSVPFWLADRSGEIRVEPEGATIETVQVLDEFRTASDTGNSTRLSFGGFSLDVGALTGSGRRTLGYRYVESILPSDRQIFVVATASDAHQDLMLHQPTEPGRAFIISLKPEEVLIRSTQQAITYSLAGMIASLGIGVILLVIGLLRG
jgi:E3 Ubiquitin ligase